MNQSLRRWLLGGGIFLFLAINLAWLSQRAHREEARRVVEERQRPVGTARSGGAPEAVNRVDKYISEVQQEGFDELVDHLDKNEFVVTFAGLHPSANNASDFYICLSDRRVSRLYELISKSPAEERSRLARVVFDRQLAKQRDYYREAAEAWQRLSNDERLLAAILDEDKRKAVSAGLFLIALYGSVEEVFECVDQCAEFSASFTEYKLTVPDPLFLVNLYLYLLAETQSEIPPEQFLQEAIRLDVDRLIADRFQQYEHSDRDHAAQAFLSFMDRNFVPWVGWDAHTNPGDFTHQVRGVPIDTSRVERSFYVVRSWHVNQLTDTRDVVIGYLRKRLMEEQSKSRDRSMPL